MQNEKLPTRNNSYLLTNRYRKLVDPFFAGGNSVFGVPEGLKLIQSEANCEIRAKRGVARRSKGPKQLNFHQEEWDLPA